MLALLKIGQTNGVLMVRKFSKFLFCWWAISFFLIAISNSVYAHNGQSHQIEGEDANLNAALHWLELSQADDGSISSSSDIATDYQATSEALTIFSLLNSTIGSRVSSLSFIQTAPQVSTTEGLARLIVALDQNAQPFTTQRENLFSRQNQDGGFGEFVGYGSNALDTSIALIALQKAESDLLVASDALGFLSRNQLSDGGFALYGDNSSVVVTAMVLSAVRQYLYTYNISEMLSRSIDYLYEAQQQDGSWGSDWETALVLQAVIPVTTDVTRYSEAVEYLRAGQSADGDWNQRVYTTALAASALQMLNSVDVPADPEKAVIAGRIVDIQNGLPIASVNVDVLGVSTETVDLQADGSFRISNLDPDTYIVAYTASGYLGASQNITLQKGQFANVGTVRLTIAPTTALISGIITDATSGAPIMGASVSAVIGGQTNVSTTDENGGYNLLSEAGEGSLIVTANEYRAVNVSATLVAGTKVQFSPTLVSISDEPPASSTVFGRIVDEEGNSISDATISILGGVSATTNAAGIFELTGLNQGEIQVSVSKTAYETVGFSLVVPDRTNVDVGNITIRPQEVLPTTTVSGRVIDMSTGSGVSAATVVVGSLSTQTDTNGFYQVTDIPVLEFTVSVNATGYLYSGKQVSLAEHDDLNLDINIRQADLGGVEITDVVTSQTHYGAFDQVMITASVENKTSLTQGARLYVNVQNEAGEEVANFSGAFLQPLDPLADLEELAHYQQHLQETIEEFTPGEQRSILLEQWWNTLSVEPGNYTITVQALDSVSSNIVSERSTLVTVQPEQNVTLDVKALPGYVLLNSNAEVSILAEIFNRSNTIVSLNFNYQLQDPNGQVVTQGSAQFDIEPDQMNVSSQLSIIQHQFGESGYYQLVVTDVVGATVTELSQGAVFVPPSIRVRVTQSLDKNEVVPLDGVPVNSNIRVEGVDGE